VVDSPPPHPAARTTVAAIAAAALLRALMVFSFVAIEGQVHPLR
jgi:hypothetical protein